MGKNTYKRMKIVPNTHIFSYHDNSLVIMHKVLTQLIFLEGTITSMKKLDANVCSIC